MNAPAKTGELHRTVLPSHTCPYELNALDLPKRHGFKVEDYALRTRAETEAFKAEHDVKTTPQVVIGDQQIGGHDDLRHYFGKRVAKPGLTIYRPVMALLTKTALTALAASEAGSMHPPRSVRLNGS